MTELLGIALDLAAKRAAVRANLEARGASPEAIARFPAHSKPLPPLPKRATLAVADRISTQAKKAKQKRTFPTPGEARHARIKRQPIPRDVKNVGFALPPQVTARIKAIAGEVARASGVQLSQVLAYRGIRRNGVAKHLAVYFVAKLTSAPMYRIAKVFSYRDHTSARYGVQKTDYKLNIGDPVFWAVHDRAERAIKARWPEYEPYRAPTVALREAA